MSLLCHAANLQALSWQGAQSMGNLNRRFWIMLRDRTTGAVIRRYGVARFLSRLKGHAATGRRNVEARLREEENPTTVTLMMALLGMF